MNQLSLSIILVLLTANVQAEEYYRSIDQNGKVQYGDLPAKNAADIEIIQSKAEPSTDDSLPFETRRANLKFPVTLYVGEGCGNGCTQAHDFLKKRGIPFTEKNLVTALDIAAFKKESGSNQIPVIHIGTDWITGFLESRWTQALDVAGYPKNPPYGFNPPVKSSPATEKPKNK
jgi:glutaredoxin